MIRGGRDRFSAPTARFRRWGVFADRILGIRLQVLLDTWGGKYVMFRNLEHAIQYVDDQQTFWPTMASPRVAMLYGKRSQR